MDSLHIKALSVATRIGVHDWEQKINQQLLIDISIPADFSQCHDDLTNTVDYDALCIQVTEFAESSAFQLIESVAEQVAHLILQNFKVAQVTVGISKPHAVKNAAQIQVVVTRGVVAL